MKKSTRVHHPSPVQVPADNRPVVAPIYQSVKFEFDTVEETVRSMRGERPGFFYMRASNPTTRQLELTLAALQDRDDCLATASGVNAITQTLLALTKQGDHVLCFIESYGPTRYVIRRLLGRFGVTHTMLSITDLVGIEQALATTPTRLVVFESPTNPVTKIADIEAITRLARRHGAATLLDNTLAGLHQHGQYDIDFFLHSLTKYASGSGDVMGGAVIARAELLRPLRIEFSVQGGVLDPHSAFLIQRGLRTYFVRYREQSAAAGRIAEHLARHSAIAGVHYPGLPTHPQHALARAQMTDFGTVVSFDLRAGAEAGRRFTESLRLFAKAASLGSTESLALAPQMLQPHDLTPEQRTTSGITDGLVRLSIGLEDVDDLLADIDRALAAAA
ncbi:MAG: PLP-dependent transferase [Steroidobacteraceae bacterium]|nr:PLP-dependent transferase [Steroidobacteraceae bacterium]MCW5572057.1 PLP-dependent transferase [Steroidobacteraceae bacterium]